ncbi:Calponin homology domain-containing protein [Dioscorea alata]|uniref:Calponin homology domain-containing protein n=1 Tax=Dioscorea alata TaxID=55571 RepID=A0ACB7U368_DIOAL|nr:Calponin homology domain-containing protein [Dioscorea alata]
MMRRMAGEVLRVRETSPDEAETSFRELDDVFLQTQTRIWLGEVLHERFDEEMAVADLLADGELLFQVSKAVWKMILKKNVDIRHSKFFIYERTSFGKADGRYMAYPKVDSFLKICQILGMTGIDLFSPSDVVEKRDIRRVCMCIRSLSKKARLMKLNIPDFDIVTYTIAMPTGLVGGLRRSLELSQRNSSNSSGSSPSMGPRGLHKQKNFSGSFARYHDSFSESDEGESTYSEFEFQSPSSNASSPNMSSIIGESSPEDDNILNKNLVDLDARFQLDYWYQNENDLHWKSFGSNLSGDIDCGYDVNLEIAEKEYEPFGCLSHQAQTIKWNPGDTDVEKSKCSGLPQLSSNDATFYVPRDTSKMQ